MKIPFKALLAAGCLAFSAGNASAGLLFSSWLDGAQEGLDSVKAKGVMGIKLNEAMDTAWVYAAFNNLSGPITAAHFHAASRGAIGSPVVTITPWLKGNSISALWAPLAKTTVDSLLRGEFYVNIHTAANPNGEIRGQVELERDLQFVADIKGTDESPAVVTGAQGRGYFQLSADDSTLSAWVVYGQPGVSEADTITMAHFHVGSPGVNGPVGIDLTGDTAAGMIAAKKSLVSPMNGITSADFLDSLKSGKVYINFHSRKHGGGLMRGQLLPRHDRAFPIKLTGSATGIAGKGLAIVWITPDNGNLMLRASFTGLTGPVTAAHFHKGNAIVVPIDSADISAGGIMADIPLDSVATAGFSSRTFIDDLVSGAIYLNVHTTANPGGEISGTAILPSRIGSAFRLEGSQETPAVVTKAFGAGLASMDKDSTNLRFFVVADSLDSVFTLAHFHKQVAGTAGGVVLDIAPNLTMNTDKMTGLYGSGVWTSRSSTPFTKPLASAMLADSLYINIHTARNPAGAIRGQVAGIKGSAVSIFGRLPRLKAGYARLVPLAGGAGLRFQGEPGRTLRVRIVGVTGRVFNDKRLSLDVAGLSSILDLSRLRQGMYVATWEERGVKYSARFMRQ
jgi:hypothetical protein